MLEGLPPNDASILLRLVCDEPLARRAADVVVELLDPAEAAAAAFEDEASGGCPKPWILEIYLAPRIDVALVRAMLAPVIGEEAAHGLSQERVDEQDWVARSLDGLSSVRAGRFLVHGRHGRADVRANDIALEIEAALAFGTGHHGTTRGCLLALDRIFKRRRPRRILDVGTGTGVLAMAAAKALKRQVVCSDLDPVAVEAAAANARANGVGSLVRPIVAAGLRHPRIRRDGPYDLIVANILAKPLRMLAPAIGRHASRGADIVLSGLLPDDVRGIVAAYGAQGLRLERRSMLDGWATIVLGKG